MKPYKLLPLFILFVWTLPALQIAASEDTPGENELLYGDMIRQTTAGQEGIHISVGIIQGNNQSYRVYGEDGTIEPQNPLYEYEIGSISKTFTTSLLAKALSEKKISLEDPISAYLDIPFRENDPIIADLATHTSGYGDMWNNAMTWKVIRGRNPFQAYDQEAMTKTILKKELKNEDYEWEYSNFGMAVLGAVLGTACETTFQQEMQAFIHNDLHLEQTRWGDGKGNLDGYWEWNSGDVYLAAGGIVSTIDDMMQYAQIQISGSLPYLSCTYERYAPLGPVEVNGAWIDGMGLGWILDQEHGIIWHNGGTGNFNSYIGIDREKQTAVVVLSNRPDDLNYPADMIGASLLRVLTTEKNP